MIDLSLPFLFCVLEKRACFPSGIRETSEFYRRGTSMVILRQSAGLQRWVPITNYPVWFLVQLWPRLALWAILCAGTILETEASVLERVLSSSGGAKPEDLRTVYAKPFITAEKSQFGDKIEGTSVDSLGRVYAVDFGGETSQLGQLSNEKGEVEQRLFFKSDDSTSYFNGIRFYPVPEDGNLASMAIVADKKGQVVQVLASKDDEIVSGRVFCKDDNMIEPNDVAVAYRSGKVYSTGLNYAPTTTHGDGDFWLCEITDGTSISSPDLGSGPVAKATRLNVQGRANGIEISNNEKHLYVSETWATNMKIYSNIVWKYDIDQQTGHLSNKQLFFDMKEIDEDLQGKAGDIDGVRTDMAGNLFLVRNGEPGEVIKVSPAGVIVHRIKLPGITEPTNIELGGPEGKTLFIVGKCAEMTPDGVQVACTDIWEGNDTPGRAFYYLVRSARQHDEL